jgi:alpha-galactosidase
VPNLPPGAVVEVPAVVDGEGIHPIGIGELPKGLAAVLSHHALVQELTAEAAVNGDVGALRQAMTADPLLSATLEPPELEALMADLLQVNAPYLPQFEQEGRRGS